MISALTAAVREERRAGEAAGRWIWFGGHVDVQFREVRCSPARYRRLATRIYRAVFGERWLAPMRIRDWSTSPGPTGPGVLEFASKRRPLVWRLIRSDTRREERPTP